MAQEECLCRSSNLYPCLEDGRVFDDFYRYHQEKTDYDFSDRIVYSPGITVFKDDAPVVEAIAASGADCVFVCLGAPKQEFWIKKNGPATGAHLLCGLGGSLDVFAGTVERAPKFWCDHGLEWFYRLMKNPSRIGRMMKLPLFLIHVQQEKRRK